MEKMNQMSLIEAAEYILANDKKPRTFVELFNECVALLGLDQDVASEKIGQFYTDFVSCAKFIYCGEDLWDLKSNQLVDNIDKEFYAEHKDVLEEFISGKSADKDDEESDESDEDAGNEDDEDEDEDYEETIDNYDATDNLNMYDSDYIEPEDVVIPDEDDFDDLDEDEYNEIMDDYEDLYDK